MKNYFQPSLRGAPRSGATKQSALRRLLRSLRSLAMTGPAKGTGLYRGDLKPDLLSPAFDGGVANLSLERQARGSSPAGV